MCLLIGCVCLAASALEKYSYKPKDGFVPDERTAIAIAVAVWTPIYGEKALADEKPFRASLKDGIWIVEGTVPEGLVGGTVLAEISKQDGRIIAVVHER
jgi:hypothetical protein